MLLHVRKKLLKEHNKNANSSMTRSSSTYLRLRCIQKYLSYCFDAQFNKCEFTKPLGYKLQ